MCYNFDMIFFSIITFFIIIYFLLFAGFINILKKYNRLLNDVSKIYLAVKRVRYGDINVRLDNLNNKELEVSTNRLFETMYDRELMIKEYQTTLSKKNLSLEEVIKQEKQLQLFKEEFAATLTHDMKVPVIAELNSLNYLLDGRFGSLNEKQSEILKLMKSSNQELKELIENMLETYKLEQKSIRLNKSRNSINSFINSIVEEMRQIAIQTEHKIIVNLEQTKNVEIEFDIFQLKRVIKNLLQNALSFSPDASEIILETELYDEKIKILFTNKGTGISKDDLDLIFKKYYCGHSKFRKAGTGLGLYLSQQIVLAHNGNIEVDSSIEGQTTFVLTLPF